MKHSKTTFLFLPEHGARLRELRRRRKLSMRSMALLMDRHQPGSFNLLAKLERGELKYPSFGLVADYLRACGAGFRDLLDLLDKYTSQEPVMRVKGNAAVAKFLKSLPGPEQRAMLKWEKSVSRALEEKVRPGPAKPRRRVETDQQRVFRIIRAFVRANWSEVFEQKLFEALQRLGRKVPTSERKQVCRFGRRMFGVMTRHYATEQRRKRALELVEKQARDYGLSDEVIANLVQAGVEAYSELERSDRLDWQPTQEQVIKTAGKAPRVLKAEARLDMARFEPVMQYNRMLSLVSAMVKRPVNLKMEELRLDFNTYKYYLNWVDKLVAIGVEHGTESPEWAAEVERAAPRLHDANLAREVARIAAEAFNVWKVKLPARPDIKA